MTKVARKPLTITTLLAMQLALQASFPTQALAENPLLTQGIQDYNSGDYDAAAGHLGSALSAEFSNPVLHYYLGNTYVRLNRKESAIKEFRIAFALEPDKKVGKLAKQALNYLGADTGEPAKAAAPEPAKPIEPPKDPLLEKTKSALKEQAETAKTLVRSRYEQDAIDASKRTAQMLEKAQKDLLDSLAKKRGSGSQSIPADSQKQLDALKQLLDAQKTTNYDRNNQRAQEIEKSAANLQDLLEQKNSKAGLKLNPVGTNLYVRNYSKPEGERADKPEKSDKSSAAVKVDKADKVEKSDKSEKSPH